MIDRATSTLPRSGRTGKVGLAVVLSASAALAATLSVRNLTGHDLGYHLAYGDVFWSQGRIVDTSEMLWLVEASVPPGKRAAPGPGCWWDAQGRYRFPNANWLSQVLFSAVHSRGGLPGLVVLQAVLILLIFALAVLAAWRMGAPPAATGLLVLLIGITAQVRFGLRPETPGFVLLLAQLVLLAPLLHRDGPRPIGLATVAGLIALQVLFVNFHSYFLLGLALTGAVTGQQLLEWMMSRHGRGDRRVQARREVLLISFALGGQLLACLVNPWTWRLAVMPIQTVLFLRRHGIAGATGGVDGHPWAMIAEFFTPFSRGYLPQYATWGYVACLALAAGAVGTGLARRRWGPVLILIGMTLVSLSMRRNIAPYSMIAAPVSLALLAGPVGRILASVGRGGRRVRWAGQGLVVVALGLVTLAVVTQQFYFRERKPTRFAALYSRVALPLGATQWLSENRLQGRMWTDYTSSSNFMYFTRTRPTAPVLTNTWAYPPATMQLVLDVSLGKRPHGPLFDAHNVQVVALRVDPVSAERSRAGRVPLITRLIHDPAWALMHVDTTYVVFARRDGVNAEAVATGELTRRTFDLQAHQAMLAQADPIEAYGLYAGATTLVRIGWFVPAEKIYRRVVKLVPEYFEAWTMRGVCLAELAARDGMAGRDELIEARKCLVRALEIEPGHELANLYYERVNMQIEYLDRGVPWRPRNRTWIFPPTGDTLSPKRPPLTPE